MPLLAVCVRTWNWESKWNRCHLCVCVRVLMRYGWMKKAGWPASKGFGLFEPLRGAIWCHSLFAHTCTHVHTQLHPKGNCSTDTPLHHPLSLLTPSAPLSVSLFAYKVLASSIAHILLSLTHTDSNLFVLPSRLPPSLWLPAAVPEEPAPMHILAPLLSSSLLCLSPAPHK